MFRIVPNTLRAQINALIDSTPGTEGIDDATRQQLYADILDIYDEHGELPTVKMACSCEPQGA